MKPIYNTTITFKYKNSTLQVKNVPCSLDKTTAMLNLDFKQRVLRLYGKEKKMTRDAISRLRDDAPKVTITNIEFHNQIGNTNDTILSTGNQQQT